MISLRISEEEYEALHRLYRSYGARNVSDFARIALERLVNPSRDADFALREKLAVLEDRLLMLEHRLSELVGKGQFAS